MYTLLGYLEVPLQLRFPNGEVIRGAWLFKINGTAVTNIADVVAVSQKLASNECPVVTMLFAHPEICPSLSQDGVPIVSCPPFSRHTHEQMNNRWEFHTVTEHLQSSKPTYQLVPSGNVLNVIT